ncbi:MAG: hypothetical protein KDJ83_15585 [Rhodobacteraceae bacterium]|nr:hypothetical protein [Paracoccaceae bacterium]
MIIDEAAFIEEAVEAGYVAPEDVEALRVQLDRAQADLDAVRTQRPDVKAEVDRAIRAANAGDRDAAQAAFAAANATIEEAAEAARLEQARLKSAEATLLYPFRASQAEPLLCEAAELAATDIWYWIECGRAREETGSLNGALAAYETALEFARRDGAVRDVSVALDSIGDVRVAQGDLPGALDAYDEGLGIRRDLAARDPGNAGWARDVVVSLAKLAQADPGKAVAHWAEAADRVAEMAARGVLAPTDGWMLEYTREQLAAARTAEP